MNGRLPDHRIRDREKKKAFVVVRTHTGTPRVMNRASWFCVEEGTWRAGRNYYVVGGRSVAKNK